MERPESPLDRAIVLKRVSALSSEIFLKMDVIDGAVEVSDECIQIYHVM